MDSILVNGYGQYRNPSNHSIGAISIRETYLIPEAETFVVGKSVLFALDLLNLILLISIKYL